MCVFIYCLMQRPVVEPELCNQGIITAKPAGFPLAGVGHKGSSVLPETTWRLPSHDNMNFPPGWMVSEPSSTLWAVHDRWKMGLRAAKQTQALFLQGEGISEEITTHCTGQNIFPIVLKCI